MPRGVRKSSKEKLLEKLRETLDSIDAYKAAIKTLEQQVDSIEEELTKLKLMEISALMDENHLTPDGLKTMIETYASEQQAG